MIPIKHGATGTVLNPWFEYPITTMISAEGGMKETAPTISAWSLMPFPEYGLELVAGPRELIFADAGDHQGAGQAANVIEAYIEYRTLIAYNLVGAADVPEPPPHPVDPLRFARLRMHLEEVNGHIVYRGSTEEFAEVSSVEVHTFLRVFDQPLAQALQHYLNVTDVRYILMEYHKAFEALAEALGGTLNARKLLAPYGIMKSEQSAFSALCNDQSRAPSELSRHAALPGADVHRVDPRRAYEDARFMRDFDAAATFCRKMIDAYVDYRANTS